MMFWTHAFPWAVLCWIRCRHRPVRYLIRIPTACGRLQLRYIKKGIECRTCGLVLK